MDKYLSVCLEDGSTLLVTTHKLPEERKSGRTTASSQQELGSKVLETQAALKDVLPPVSGFAKEVSDDVRGSCDPDEFELSFSVALSTEAKAVVVSAGAEASFTVKLKWKKKQTG